MGISQSLRYDRKEFITCNLSNKNIINLKEYIGKKKLSNDKYTQLILWNNRIEDIPVEILESFTSLVSLDFSHNLIKVIPNTFFETLNLKFIKLSFNNISEVPSSIGMMSTLRELDLQCNSLETLPPSISGLSNLYRLDIRSNIINNLSSIHGLKNLAYLKASFNVITSINSDFSKLENLKELNLRMNNIKDISERFVFKHLQYLDLSYNNLSKLPKSISQLINLLELDVSHNKIKTLPDLAKLTKLEMLNISHNNFTKIPNDLPLLEELKTFDASFNRIKILPESVKNFVELEHINLKRNRLESVPSQLFDLDFLKEVNLSFNRLTKLPPNICNARSLQNLNLDFNKIKSLPQSLSKLRKLKYLGLGLNEINDKEFQNIEWSALESLIELRLHGNILTSIPENITFGNQLQRLFLGYNGIKAYNAYCTRALQQLQLSGNKLKSIPDQIFKLTNLKNLWINNNEIDEINPNISQLKSLHTLDISMNNIKEIPTSIKLLTQIYELSLSRNKLSTLPNVFKHLQKLRSLDLSFNSNISEFPKSILQSPQTAVLKLNYCNIQSVNNIDFSREGILYEGNPFVNISGMVNENFADIFKFSENRNVTQEDSPVKDYFYDIDIAEMQGDRVTMEDAYLIKDKQPIVVHGKIFKLFVIFDGHGDSRVADFCSRNFHIELENCLIKKLNPNSENDEFISEVKESIHDAFYAVNDKLDDSMNESGATVALALFHNDHLFTASCGDARITINLNGKAQRLTMDHKASNIDERLRIHKLGGYVTDNHRVMNRIAISRSIGDKEYQPYMSCEPYINHIQLNEDCKSLIIACDGLWDVIDDQTAVKLLDNFYNNNNRTYVGSASYLSEIAYLLKCLDNISVIVMGIRKP